jgi:hypothetical protein
VVIILGGQGGLTEKGMLEIPMTQHLSICRMQPPKDELPVSGGAFFSCNGRQHGMAAWRG